MVEKFMKIGGNDAGIARGIKVDRFGEIVQSGENINYLQSINLSLAAGTSQEYTITRPHANFIALFLTQSVGNKVSISVRHKLPDIQGAGLGALNYVEERVFNQVQGRQVMSDWIETKTTTTTILVTNNGTSSLNSQIVVYGKRRLTGNEYLPKTEVLSRVEFTDWGQYNYMTLGKDTITTGSLSSNQYLDFTRIKDVKILIESTLTSDIKLTAIRTFHANYGELFRTNLSDYYEDELLTIKNGQAFQFGTRETRGLSDVNILDDLFTERTSITLTSIGSEIPTGKIEVTILGREF